MTQALDLSVLHNLVDSEMSYIDHMPWSETGNIIDSSFPWDELSHIVDSSVSYVEIPASTAPRRSTRPGIQKTYTESAVYQA